MSVVTFYKSADTFYSEMISTVTDVDTSKHSLIYNALKPSSFENANQTLMLDESLKMVFAKTAYENGYDDYLDLHADQVGLTRKIAAAATGIIKVIGIASYILPSGTIVSTSDGVTFTTDADLTLTDTTGYVKITATSTGTSYNVSAGAITTLPVKYTGITSITNEDATIGGADKETNEELYNRIQIKKQEEAGNGNEADYKNWCLLVDGVGYAKVYSLKDSSFSDKNGCVTCVVAASDKSPVDSTIIDNVKAYIKTKASIGATLYVVTTQQLALNIVVNGLSYNSTNYSLETVKSNISTALSTYIKDLESDITEISFNQVSGVISNATGVKDLSNITINSGSSNVTLTTLQVPTIGTVTYN